MTDVLNFLELPPDIVPSHSPRGLTVPYASILANVRANLARGLQSVQGPPVMICGPGPSLVTHLPMIQRAQQNGVEIWSLKGVWRTLTAFGIRPDAVVMSDASPKQIEYVKGAPDGMRWYLATQVDPSIYDALVGQDIVTWNAAIDKARELYGPDALVLGQGKTVAVAAVMLACILHFLEIFLVGVDCSWPPGQRSHSYDLAEPEHQHDGMWRSWFDSKGREHKTTLKMARDARDLLMLAGQSGLPGITIYGDGLLACLAADYLEWREKQKQERQTGETFAVGPADEFVLDAADKLEFKL